MRQPHTSRSVRLLMHSLLLLLAALPGCASGPGAVGVASTLPQLGAPIMVPTALGRIAVWDPTPQASGPPVVLWPSIFSDHTIYAATLGQLGGRRVLLIDGPGHGSSEGPSERSFTMQECAVALKTIMDSRSITSAVVGGTSWGGLVGAEFALLYPDRTAGLLLLNTPFFTTPGGPSVGERLITWGARHAPASSLFTQGVARSFFSPATRAAGGPVMERFHTHLRQSDAASLGSAVRSVLLEREALAPRLSRIQAPTLVIAGDQDAMYPRVLQREAAAQLPRGRLVVVGSQHISAVDAPAATAAAIRAFIDAAEAERK